MHGLINRSIQCFVRDAYGAERWRSIARACEVGPEGFEAMLEYDDSVTDTLLAVVAQDLGKPEAEVLEDLGIYLVSHETMQSVRRLLRFSGETFVDFLHSLDDLPSRAHLAMPDLEMPQLELREEAGGRFRLFVLSNQRGWGYVMLGLLRAMADDYGALVVMEMAPGASTIAVIEIGVLDGSYAQGRSFSLAGASDPLPDHVAPEEVLVEEAPGADPEEPNITVGPIRVEPADALTGGSGERLRRGRVAAASRRPVSDTGETA